jgi:hypothetical protein
MNSESSAEQDLRVIRSLMERATIYRAISAPSALVAGFLSVLAAGGIYWNNEVHPFLGRTVRPREFVGVWLVVLVLSLAANLLFLWREANAAGRTFFSSGMKLALRSVAPNLLIPTAFTLWFYQTGYLGAQELQLVAVWVAFYGLCLLSTSLFAPRSLAILGWAFLLTSLCMPVLGNAIDDLTDDAQDTIMGVSFGLYHLIYAVCTWSGKRTRDVAPTSE